MKQKSTILSILCAFILMMACTPSSLHRGKNPESNVEDITVSLPEVKAPAIGPDSVTLPALLDSLRSLQPVSEVPQDSIPADTTATASQEQTDAPQDSIPDGAQSAIKTKRDTTTMDSLELAIYKHNKAIDDSLALDSINRHKKNGIDSPVEYSADDSLTYDATSATAHLYGQSKVKYQNMDLASERIFMSLDSNLVHATGKRDSTTNELMGTPVFKMGSDEYQNTEMSFNFKSKKGLITDVYTQQEDGYLTSELSKRGANGEMFLQHGRYTTCDDPHPDFYIAMSRAKVRPGKDVVFGPAYLVVADVPLPLAIPYGFFPFTRSYSSGFIMPTYGDETTRGFYLRDGGYYFAVSDRLDLKLTGEIFTKGSWGINAATTYRKRYKYSGNFQVNYQSTVEGEKNMPDYNKTTSFKLNWTHTQDAKANPFHTFSARVNYATQNYEQNNLASLYNPESRTQSTRTSAVSYRTSFSSIGMTIGLESSVSQNMRDSIVDLTLPSLDISVAKFYPLRRKKMVGDERWYEKISMQYTGNINNSIHTKEEKLLHSNLSRDWKNGMKHSIPINASFTLFDYLSVTPNINFNAQTHFAKVKKSWDSQRQSEVTDTLSGFYNTYDWNMGISANTTLYGFWVPNRKIFGNKIDRIRHVFKPQVSFSYNPDFSAERYGHYETYQKTDADGNVSLVNYTPYSVSQYAASTSKMAGSIAVTLGNNLEMKVRDSNDSLKKVSLIDDMTMNMSYNLATKDQPLSPLTVNLRLKLTKSYTYSMNAVFKSYVYELDENNNPVESRTKTYWEQGKLGRFQGMSQNLNFNLTPEKVTKFFKWLKGEKTEDEKDSRNKKGGEDEEDLYDTNPNIDKEMEKGKYAATQSRDKSKAATDKDGYMSFKIPWSLHIGYTIQMSEGNTNFNYDTMRYPYQFTQNLNFSGNISLSEGWNINISSGYDFERKRLSQTVASLSRDLHCFNMSCQVTLAPYTSYNFSFRCNAGTLADALKYDKQSGYTNAVQWY